MDHLLGLEVAGERRAHVKTVLDCVHGDYVSDKRLLLQIYEEVKQRILLWAVFVALRLAVPAISVAVQHNKILPPIPHVDGWWWRGRNSNCTATGWIPFRSSWNCRPARRPSCRSIGSAHSRAIRRRLVTCRTLFGGRGMSGTAYLLLRPLTPGHRT